jgi:transposase-like protein
MTGAVYGGQVMEALGGIDTISQIAQEYGIHPVYVGQWK